MTGNLRTRLAHLEKHVQQPANGDALLIFAGPNPTPEDQSIIDEAEAAGRIVMNVCFVKANYGKPEDTHCAA